MAFNSIHTALESAVNILLLSGFCSEINLVQSPSFEVLGGEIIGAGYRVECAKPAAFVVEFDTPELREDGSVLLSSDISGYEIEFKDGCFYGWTVTKEGKSSGPAFDCLSE
tara:strand:+ start:3233 stop:3565 length:333 start_codon:yes stop_codon:yes gene_type:complete